MCKIYMKFGGAKRGKEMKIDELNQQTVAYVAKVRNEKQQEVPDSHSDVSAKQQGATDKVELSSYIPVTTRAKEVEEIKPNRVEELKAQLASGSYNIPGRAVAEKMMSNIVKAISS
jgi:negative regulator of flagellin synthesis FlgM